jgi:DNA repair exonuclease SbcCD ATPase subunit
VSEYPTCPRCGVDLLTDVDGDEPVDHELEGAQVEHTDARCIEVLKNQRDTERQRADEAVRGEEALRKLLKLQEDIAEQFHTAAEEADARCEALRAERKELKPPPVYCRRCGVELPLVESVVGLAYDASHRCADVLKADLDDCRRERRVQEDALQRLAASEARCKTLEAERAELDAATVVAVDTWTAKFSACTGRIAEVEAERDELRELLIGTVPEDLVCLAETQCPSCGETLTGRLGTELKFKIEALTRRVAQVEAERDASNEQAANWRKAFDAANEGKSACIAKNDALTRRVAQLEEALNAVDRKGYELGDVGQLFEETLEIARIATAQAPRKKDT